MQKTEDRGQKTEDREQRSEDRLKNPKSEIPACRQAGRNPKSEIVGFTLIELMLVVIIIGVLAAMIVPRFTGRSQQAKIAAAKADINTLSTAIDLYELDNGKLPEALSDLWEKPGGTSSGNWQGPYLKKKNPKDPWGNEYEYQKCDDCLAGYEICTENPVNGKICNTETD